MQIDWPVLWWLLAAIGPGRSGRKVETVKPADADIGRYVPIG